MIEIEHATDIDRAAVQAVAYEGERIRLAPSLLAAVDEGRRKFLRLIDSGVPCYGVTTGLGRLADNALTGDERDEIACNILRARACAFGPPMDAPVVRALMFIRLVNFLSARDGVRAELCRFIADRLNDDFTPWVPGRGHGMAADAIANSHAFQTFIGEGYVLTREGRRQASAEALSERGVQAFLPVDKEGIALINGLTASVAYALHASRRAAWCLSLANLVAAVSIEGMAAPKDLVHPAIKTLAVAPGTAAVIDILNSYLAGSAIAPHRMQPPVSYRAVPQVHGELADALATLEQHIDRSLETFSGNPLPVDDAAGGPALLSVGLFHDQHLVNQIDHLALSLAHVGVLSQRRLHRLLDANMTGLSEQLAARPGLDAGLVAVQKASLGVEARLRMLAHPVSLSTGESSGGQEDYMAMAVPTAARLMDMAEALEEMLASELLAALVAVDVRGGTPGAGVKRVRSFFSDTVAAWRQDRSPGPDIEIIVAAFRSGARSELDSLGDLVEHIERGACCS